jgi:hypothetical protein
MSPLSLSEATVVITINFQIFYHVPVAAKLTLRLVVLLQMMLLKRLHKALTLLAFSLFSIFSSFNRIVLNRIFNRMRKRQIKRGSG